MQIDALQNTNCRGEIAVYFYAKTRLEVANPFWAGVNLHFGGCQFTFWRPKMSWGCFIERGDPQKGWYFGFPRSVWRPQSRYTMSRTECRIKFPQNQRCRAKIALHPHKSRCRTFSGPPPPPSHFPVSLTAGPGGLVEGIAALLGSEN